MRILLTGRTGQVGSALIPALSPLGEVFAFERQRLDFLDPMSISRAVEEVRPAVIVNAAGYTAVDRAETDRDAAFEVNFRGVKDLAREAKLRDALLVHFSTDYVFDGEKGSPYVETDATSPLNVYGKSKLEGERAIASSGCRHLIFRTSWVYGPSGRNFLHSIIAAAQAKPELRVVNDQHGAPTSSGAIAAAVAQILSRADIPRMPGGLFHLSAGGATSWHAFAAAILQARGLNTSLVAVGSDEYPVAARRPRNSLLDNSRLGAAFGVSLPDWREGLAAVLAAIH